MSLVNIISAIGNNSSVYPLLIRDCGIENPIKIGLTYKQNLKESKQMAKDALRERTIDEYVCSVIWLGGIPVMGINVTLRMEHGTDISAACGQLRAKKIKGEI